MMHSDSGGGEDTLDASSTTTARDNRGSLFQGKGELDARLTSIRDANRTIREDRTDRMEDYLEVSMNLFFRRAMRQQLTFPIISMFPRQVLQG